MATQPDGPVHGHRDATEEKKLWHYKIATLFCKSFILLNFGFCEGIVGPTSLQMATRLSINQHQVTKAFALRGAGEVLGAIAAGLFKDYFLSYVDWCLGACALIIGIGTAAIPFSSGEATLSVAYVVQGIGCAGGAAASMAYVINLWESVGLAYGVITAAYAAGGVIAPLIAAVFYAHDIKDPVSEISSICNASLELQHHHIWIGNPNFWKHSRIHTLNELLGLKCLNESEQVHPITGAGHVEGGYLVIALLCALNAALFIAVALFTKPSMDVILKPYRDVGKNTKETTEAREKELTTLPYRAFVYFVFVLYSGAHHLVIQGIGRYVFPFSVVDLLMEESSATALNVLYFVVPAISRIGFGVMVRYVSTVTTTNVGTAIAVAMATVLSLYGLNSPVVWWITVLTSSFFIGILYPAGFAYLNVFVPVSGTVMAAIEAGMAGGQLCFFIPAYFEENYGPKAVLFVFTVGLALCFLITLSTLCLSYLSCSRKEEDKRTRRGNLNEHSPLVNPD